MDSEVVHSQVHENDEYQPHNGGSQLEEQRYDHDEKKSVLTKVKAKAKKIKETIKKHGHHVLDQDHDNNSNNEDQNSPDDHDLDEVEKMSEDQKVDGAPVGESEDVKSTPPTYEQVENFVESATVAVEQGEDIDKLGVNSGGTEEETHQEPRVVGASPTTESNQNIATEPVKTFVEEEKPGQSEVNLERPKGLDEDPRTPGVRLEAYTPPSYQTQVTDPTGTGADEIDIAPVAKSFERMNVQDEPKPIPEPKVLPEFAEFAETQYTYAESHGQFVPKPDPELSSATKTEHPSAEIHHQNLPPEPSIETKTQYSSAGINEQLVPEISTATETQYSSGENHDQFAPGTISTGANSYKENPQETVQTFSKTTDIVEEQPSHESVEKPSNQSSFTDEISSAENAADSEMRYGEKGDGDNKVRTLEEEKSENAASNKSGSSLEYGKNIANPLTKKLAPVYGKVAEVGSAVKSKVSGTRTSGDSVGVEAENVGKEQDKGVSVKDYLAEKLKPGEEDKALSQVIAEALYKRKEDPKKASEDDDKGIVGIEKKEEEQLGSGNEKPETVSEESNVNVNSPGEGVVGKIKGVVGSWFGKSEENRSAQVAGGEDLTKIKNSGIEVERVSQAEGERRLQE